MLALHTPTGDDVIPHPFKPRHLIPSERYGFPPFGFDPLGEPVADMFLERLKHGFLFQRDADERNKVSKSAGLGTKRTGGTRCTALLEGGPQLFNRGRPELRFQLCLEIPQGFLRDAFVKRSAVEDLQRVDFSLVRFDILPE